MTTLRADNQSPITGFSGSQACDLHSETDREHFPKLRPSKEKKKKKKIRDIVPSFSDFPLQSREHLLNLFAVDGNYL